MQIQNAVLGFLLEFSFRLEGKAFSLNNYHYRDKRHKTREARDWEAQIVTQLQELKPLVTMAEEWQKSGGYFVLELFTAYPSHIFYTQSGEISGKTFDCTNVEKPLQDLLFKAMGLNDKLVKKVVSEKGVGTHHYMDITIRLQSA